MAADVTMEVRSDEVLVLVTKMHHFLLDVCRFVTENHCDDAHQITIVEFLILKLTEEVPARLTKYLTATSVAMIVCKLANSFKQLLRHRDADYAHVAIQPPLNIKIISNFGKETAWRQYSVSGTT